jgi:hypothetical protein
MRDSRIKSAISSRGFSIPLYCNTIMLSEGIGPSSTGGRVVCKAQSLYLERAAAFGDKARV